MRRERNCVPSFCLPRARLFAFLLYYSLGFSIIKRSLSRNATESVAFGNRDGGQNWSTRGREYWPCLNPGSLVWSCIVNWHKVYTTFDCHLIYYFHWQAGRQGREKFGSKKATKKRLNQFASTSNKVRDFILLGCGKHLTWVRLLNFAVFWRVTQMFPLVFRRKDETKTSWWCGIIEMSEEKQSGHSEINR